MSPIAMAVATAMGRRSRYAEKEREGRKRRKQKQGQMATDALAIMMADDQGIRQIENGVSNLYGGVPPRKGVAPAAGVDVG